MGKAFASIVAGAMLAGLSVFADDAKSVAAGDFSSDLAGWEFSLGKEFPGSQGNLWRDEKEGSKGSGAASLLGDFSGGGAYVAMVKSFESPLDVQSVSISLKSQDVSGVVFRITDSTSQTFQQFIPLKESPAWQTLKIDDFIGKEGSGHWGGANDGKWHGPANGISIILDRGHLKNAESGKGSLIVDKVDLSLK